MAIGKGTRVENGATSLASGGTLTLSSVTFGGADRAGVVWVVARPTVVDGDDTIDTVVFNGSENFTQIANVAEVASTGLRVKAFRYVAPTATTADIIITTKNSACHIGAMVQPLTGVDQATPNDTPVPASNAGNTTPAIVVPSAVGDLVLGWIGHRATTTGFTADGDTTELDRVESLAANTAHVRGVLTEILGAASVSPSGVLSVSRAWCGIGINFNAAAASGSSPRSDRRRRAVAVARKRSMYL